MARQREDNFGDLLKAIDVKVVRSWDDPTTGDTFARVDVRIDSFTVPHYEPEAFFGALQFSIDDATRALRLAHRLRPRLGAGTVGYARRRR